jgi:hypothetical protein
MQGLYHVERIGNVIAQMLAQEIWIDDDYIIWMEEVLDFIISLKKTM